jgi:uncharacterized membrane protein
MRDTAIAYLAAALVMGGLDFTWLSLTRAPLYQRGIGPLLAAEPNMMAAIAFYLLYLAGVVFFAVRPALVDGAWTAALLPGAILGLVAYGTYDLTNMATLKGWPLHVTLIDMAWGCLLTAVTAGLGAWAALAWEK